MSKHQAAMLKKAVNKIVNLEEDLEKMKISRKDLRSNNKALKKHVTRLEAENKDLRREKESLRRDNETMKEKNYYMKIEIANLKAEVLEQQVLKEKQKTKCAQLRYNALKNGKENK